MNTLLKSTAATVIGKGCLSSDHRSAATGLDPAFMISKNGGNFANPAAGASVMTEIASTGWYKFVLGATDTNTVGPLLIRGTHATMDNIEVVYEVVETMTASLCGTGSTECEVTVKTTGGTAIADCKVWLSTDNDQSNPIVIPQYTSLTGVVTFLLDADGTHYIHCRKSGYSFMEASWTPTVGVPDYTASIGDAVSVVSTAASDMAFLTRTIASVKRHLDEPTLNAKYTDDILIGMIGEAYTNVISEVNRSQTNPVVGRTLVTVAESTYVYSLPYHTGTIVAVYTEDTTSGLRYFWTSRGPFCQSGRGLVVEGKTIRLQPGLISAGTVLTVEFIPGGAASLNMGRITSIAGDKTSVVLPASPTLGSLDGHVDAYVGCMIRIGLGSTLVEERLITAYDRATMTATLDTAIAWTDVSMPYYEIAPQIYNGMDHVVALYLAYWVAGVEGHPVRNARLERMYQNAMRNLRLDGFYSRLDTATDHRPDGPNYHRYRRMR